MKFALILFPGTNGELDLLHLLKNVLGQEAETVWHQETDLSSYDALIIPGGSSYGDYLRPGALAKLSPIMAAVKDFAAQGKPVLGICNGFQVLTESGLLPGAFIRNRNLKFIGDDIFVRVENNNTVFTHNYSPKQVLKLPIAHLDGNYYADPKTLSQLEEQNRIVFRYSSASGQTDEVSNPNGSCHNIAGIINEQGNVLGLMPHPERMTELILGGDDGLNLFKSILNLEGRADHE